MASMNFPILLSSAIGLHAPGFSYNSFPGFHRTTVLACRNPVGSAQSSSMLLRSLLPFLPKGGLLPLGSR